MERINSKKRVSVKIRILVLFMVCLVYLTVVSSATDYYVSTNGNNSLDGLSVENAWLTIEYGMESGGLVGGDTLYIIPDGVYSLSSLISFQNSGTSGNPITITSYNNTKPHLNTLYQDAAFNINKQWIVVSNLKFDGAKRAIYTGTQGLNFTVQNSLFSNMTEQEAIFIGRNSSYVTVDNNEFVNIRDDNINLMEIQSGYNYNQTTHHINIINNNFHDNMKISVGHNIINLKDRDNNNAGIEYLNYLNISNNIFENNTGSNSFQIGSNSGYIYNSVFMNNSIINCGKGVSVMVKGSGNTHIGNFLQAGVNTSSGLWSYNGNGMSSISSNNSIELQGNDWRIVDPLHYNAIQTISGVGSHLGTGTFENITNSKRLALKENAENIEVLQSSNYYFTMERTSGSFSYTLSDLSFFTTKSNRTMIHTDGGTNIWNVTRYNVSLTPTYDYLKDVVLDTYSKSTETYQVNVNSSIVGNPSYINITVANETGTYSVKLDGAQYTNITASNYIASLYYSDSGNEWDTNHTFLIEYSENGSVPIQFNSATPTSPYTTNYSTEIATFSVTTNTIGNITWYINGTFIQINNSATSATYSNSTAEIKSYNVTAIVDNIVSSDSNIWTWNVQQTPPPEISSYTPSTPNSTAQENGQTFTININQFANVSWMINGTEYNTNTSVNSASYLNTSSSTGSYNVSAIATNANGTVQQDWLWIITDAWSANSSVVYSMNLYNIYSDGSFLLLSTPEESNTNLNDVFTMVII